MLEDPDAISAALSRQQKGAELALPSLLLRHTDAQRRVEVASGRLPAEQHLRANKTLVAEARSNGDQVAYSARRNSLAQRCSRSATATTPPG